MAARRRCWRLPSTPTPSDSWPPAGPGRPGRRAGRSRPGRAGRGRPWSRTPPMPEHRHDISVPGGSVSVLASETMQGVPVMMLHGLTSNGAMWIDGGWTALFDRADRSWLALDLRGHGQSLKPKDPAAYRPELHANDFAAVMDALGIPRVDLIGYS